MERRLRDDAEAARRQATPQQLQNAARQSPEPLLNPASREPIDVVIPNASLRDILNFIGMATGINVTYERDYQDRTYSVNMRGVTLDQALTQILSANQLFYKVVNEHTIMVIPDNAQKRALYEEQVIRTFYISHADATEVAQILNTVIRIPQLAVAPQLVANKTNNTITVRASANIVAIIERIIEQNDNPRAEVVIDVQILEVSRIRTKEFGLDLSSYAINGVFSPEGDPRGTTAGTGTAAATDTLTPRPFNLNTISRGISTADFYLSVPTAIVHFLETDSETRLIAKPQLRGAEGQQITLNLGDDIPVPATVFTPVAQGGANFNPLTSFNYRTVGVIIQMTPRVTIEGDVILDLSVENSTRGVDVNIAGQNLPSFGSRKVQTRLRLRDGESNLLAGLLRETDRRTLSGVPGLLRLPVLRSLFGFNTRNFDQTDIVMLLTPRIVRTQELTAQDVAPIFIGTQQSLGLGGPPPLIAAPGGVIDVGVTAPPSGPQPGAPAPAAVPAGQPTAPAGGGVVVVPPGSSQVPGTTTLPAAPAQPPAPPNVPGTLVPQAGPLAPGTATVQPAPAGGSPATVAATTAATGGQIIVSPPGTDFRVGAGPYTVPVSISGASLISGVSLTLTFNPSALRVRAVQEGSFMRTGGAAATFTQQVDAATGRVDIAIVRSGDQTGVAGTGLLAAVLFDAVGGGAANLTVTGSSTGPRGTAIPLQFGTVPAVTVR